MFPQISYRTSFSRPAICLAISLGAATAAAACSSPPGPASQLSPSSGPAVTVSADQVDNQTFCDGARQAGITNMRLIANNADPKTLLAVLDQMVPTAPAAIHDDFATFVTLEHNTIDSGGPDSPPAISIDESSARTALTHVQSYLHNTCHIG